MPFKDTNEGQTHSQNDGCGMPEHNTPQPPKNIFCKCNAGLQTIGGELITDDNGIAIMFPHREDCVLMTTPQPQGWEERWKERGCIVVPQSLDELDLGCDEEFAAEKEGVWTITIKKQDGDMFIEMLLAQKEAEKTALVREIMEAIKKKQAGYYDEYGYAGDSREAFAGHELSDILATITATAGKHGITPNEQ